MACPGLVSSPPEATELLRNNLVTPFKVGWIGGESLQEKVSSEPYTIEHGVGPHRQKKDQSIQADGTA